MWECGLKRQRKRGQSLTSLVTPYVGVWIETKGLRIRVNSIDVTPYVGVWIETTRQYPQNSQKASLLMWECGLKLNGNNAYYRVPASLLMWECGLKP